MFHLAALAYVPRGGSYLHTFLVPEHAQQFASRWKPQLVSDSMLSLTGLNEYTRARIDLQGSQCPGAIAQMEEGQGRTALYVLQRDERDNMHLTSILWCTQARKLTSMRAMRRWYEACTHDDLYGTRLRDASEAELWDLAIWDA